MIESRRILWSLLVIGMLVSVSECRRRSSKGHRSLCRRGCTHCDDINGCTQCKRTFLFITKSNGKEVGECVHRCPEGYFGDRGSPTDKCLKCEVTDCKSCFARSYCTKCREDFYLHQDGCTAQCPEGLTANPFTGKCEDKVDCIVGKWSSWGKCTQKGRSCRRGRKKRTRVILQRPSENGKQCPRLKNTRKCRMPENECFSLNKLVQRQKLNERRRGRKGRRKRKGKHRIESNSAKRQTDNTIFTNKPGR